MGQPALLTGNLLRRGIGLRLRRCSRLRSNPVRLAVYFLSDAFDPDRISCGWNLPGMQTRAFLIDRREGYANQ